MSSVLERLHARSEIADRGFETPCRVTTYWLDRDGYGLVSVNGRTRRVHRVAWEMLHGPIPEGYEPHHRCEQPDCFEDSHLELLTHADNVRATGRAKQTHCKRHHPLSGENLILRTVTRGEKTYTLRECRACACIRAREQTQWKRAA